MFGKNDGSLRRVPVHLGLLAACAAHTASAHGQTSNSNITMYGILDSGVELITNADGNGRRLVREPFLSGGMFPSRLGFRGVEDLGDGLKAIFNLESGFGVSTGASQQGGRLFGRNSFVGLSGKYGDFTIGRQRSMMFYAMVDADVIGPPVISMGSFDTSLAPSWVDNSLAWRGKFGPLTIGTSVSFGRDTAAPTNCGGETTGNTNACREYSAIVKYDTGTWGISTAYDEFRGGPGSGAAVIEPGVPGILMSNANDKDKRIFLTGFYNVGPVKIGSGWVGRRLKAAAGKANANMYFLGMSYRTSTPWTLDAEVVNMLNPDQNAHGKLAVFRAIYALSKRTSLYGLIGHMGNEGPGSVYSISSSSKIPALPKPGDSQKGLLLGMAHFF